MLRVLRDGGTLVGRPAKIQVLYQHWYTCMSRISKDASICFSNLLGVLILLIRSILSLDIRKLCTGIENVILEGFIMCFMFNVLIKSSFFFFTTYMYETVGAVYP